MAYEITWYDFDRSQHETRDGFHCESDGIGPIDALLNWIRDFAKAEDGTRDRDDYLSMTEAETSTDDVIVVAYRNDTDDWEVHVHVDGLDTAFTFESE